MNTEQLQKLAEIKARNAARLAAYEANKTDAQRRIDAAAARHIDRRNAAKTTANAVVAPYAGRMAGRIVDSYMAECADEMGMSPAEIRRQMLAGY